MEGPGAHPARELHEPLGDGSRRVRDDQQVLARATPARGTTAATSSSTRPRRSARRALARVRLDPEKWGVNVQSLSRLAGQLPGLHRVARTARSHHGPRPAPRRPPLARVPDGHQEDLRGVDLLRVHAVPPGRVAPAASITTACEACATPSAPSCIIAGASRVLALYDYKRMRAIARQVGSYLLADMAHISGLVAAEMIARAPFESRGRRDDDDAQVAPRAARRDDLLP